ncbi:hypothetical protein FLK61_39330 [Paenalkalicoccus suaedae]|uniref:Uncharacterized protein n=1 Tax=Paenalkalicoccus suaedae TaxID=2592382 RepID=A0A859FII0_9BACI|nr:hypothetical protein [Paenalkalicoccus suaedae]QKS72668.1 hypothetical protein FLK61_39330 [Paenalkalicoccus suaedae]
MAKVIAGSILLLTASILFIGNYLIGAIIANGQGISSTETLAWILTGSMQEYIPYPHYLSIVTFIAGVALLVWGLVEDTMLKTKAKPPA